MIKFFRNSYFINYLLLFMMASLLWLPSFIVLPEACHPSGTTPIYDFIVTSLESKPLLLQIIAFVLFVVEAFCFNEIMVVGKIEHKVSTIGSLAFILLMGLTSYQTMFQPALLASLFVLPILYVLYKIPSSQSAETDLLNAGFCIALASMSYVYSALLLIWVMVSLSITKSRSVRYQLISVIGFLLPYLFYFAILFFRGNIVEVAKGYSDFFTGFSISFDGYDIVSLVVFAILVLVSFLPLNENVLYAQERNVDVRHNISTASLMFLFTLVMMFMEGSVFSCGLAFLALSVHNTYSMSHLSKTIWPEFLLDMAVIAIYVMHYLPLFS